MASSKTVEVKSPRKLIEVALPLDKINEAAAREKSLRYGHPSTLHQWWSRKPLGAARAVLFAQLVNDPGYERHLNRGVNKVEAVKERERLFKIIEDLVIWENTNNETVWAAARAEIWKSWRETCELNRSHPDAATLFNPEKMPAFHDPFAGGGTIPMEAQRLGLESYASDLNPVAVTINKAMIEIPPRFAGLPPVGPVPSEERDPGLARSDWPGGTGLAEDVRRYGAWMRAEAEKRVGYLYPKVEITAEMAAHRADLEPLIGQHLTIIAWIWARAVKSPNPAYSHVDVPLVATFILSSKPGKESYVHPIIDGDKYHFTVRAGKPPTEYENGTKLSRGANFRCLLSNSPIEPSYIKAEGVANRMGTQLMAVVAEGKGKRVYLAPDHLQESAAEQAVPTWRPETKLPNDPRNFWTPSYGLTTFGDLFTPRQLVLLNTLCDIVSDAVDRCNSDCELAAEADNRLRNCRADGGEISYGQAVATYLAFVIDKVLVYCSSQCPWLNQPKNEIVGNTFGRQTFPMMWGFAESNPFAGSSGDILKQVAYLVESLAQFPGSHAGFAVQADAGKQNLSLNKVVSTDPPYYDNIVYADLSDFFYVWLRRSLGSIFPSIYSTMSAPKIAELVATPYRHGGTEQANHFFIDGMTGALHNIAEYAHPAFPVTIYYAFKQSDTNSEDGTSSSGWDTFLTAVLKSGFSICGTWPMRTERPTALKSNVNALASSIVLVCRKRDPEAPTISRREFLRELHAVLPDALIDMTRGGINSPVAPVDLSQSIIGPGMGIFSKYKAVLEADGTPMTVRTALQLINRFLADDDFDPETQFCLQWFETNYWKAGLYGSADVAARAKGTNIEALSRSRVLDSGGGEVQLLRWNELPADWKPDPDEQTPVWQALHQLIRNLNMHGEQSAGALLLGMSTVSGPVRTLAYRLYTLCERKGLAEDARFYNELIGAWAAIEVVADEIGPTEKQGELF